MLNAGPLGQHGLAHTGHHRTNGHPTAQRSRPISASRGLASQTGIAPAARQSRLVASHRIDVSGLRIVVVAVYVLPVGVGGLRAVVATVKAFLPGRR